MSREGQHIHAQLRHLHRRLTHGLHRVCVQQHAAPSQQAAQFRHRLQGAYFIVGQHQAHQQGIRPQGLLHLSRADKTILVRRQIGNLKALPLQIAATVQHGRVFNAAGDDMPTLKAASHTQNGQVIRFCAARGKINLIWLRT